MTEDEAINRHLDVLSAQLHAPDNRPERCAFSECFTFPEPWNPTACGASSASRKRLWS
jgi:hypothetical protein